MDVTGNITTLIKLSYRFESYQYYKKLEVYKNKFQSMRIDYNKVSIIPLDYSKGSKGL